MYCHGQTNKRCFKPIQVTFVQCLLFLCKTQVLKQNWSKSNLVASCYCLLVILSFRSFANRTTMCNQFYNIIFLFVCSFWSLWNAILLIISIFIFCIYFTPFEKKLIAFSIIDESTSFFFPCQIFCWHCLAHSIYMLGFLEYLSLQMEHPPFHFHDWKQEYDLVDILLLCGMDHIIILTSIIWTSKCVTYLGANCVGGTPLILVMPPNILPNHLYHNHS